MALSPSSVYQFFSFGSPRLQIAGQAVPLPPQPAALCAFLVLNRRRRVTREEIQAVFWPEAAPDSAQERLRRALYLLRQALAPHAALVMAEGAELTIAPEADLWVDYEAFERLLQAACRQAVPQRDLLEQAVALYSDDLLKDIYAEWALMEREHARQQYLAALRSLLTACQHDQDWPAVIQVAHTLLAQDPYQEVAHRALMRAYAAAGDRSAALHQYQHCAAILREELGAEPLPDTIQLYEDIRQGRGIAPERIAVTVSAPHAVLVPDLEALPLIGREPQLEAIAAEWQICQRRRSRLVLVMGPAGMGKTRLVQEATRRIPGPGVLCVTGYCYAMEAATPYRLIADLLPALIDLVWERLGGAARADLAHLVPALQERLRPGDRARPALGLEPGVRIQEAVTQAVRLAAEAGAGLWIVAEDLHWADPASLAVLNHVLRRCADLPVLVLATLRSEEVSYDSPLLDWPVASVSAPAPTTLIELPPLQPAHLDHLVAGLVGERADALTALLQHETAGNPLFLVETLRVLVEQGVLFAEAGQGWRLRTEALPAPADLPMSEVVLRVMRSRLRRLTRAAQDVLTLAAVIEHDIDEGMLRALSEPGIALELALDELLRAAILQETAPGVYQFSHIKVREVIYADTSAPRRRFLHRGVAAALASRGGPERLADVAQLVYHATRAGDWTAALRYGWRAAQIALAAGALAEANRYAEQAQQVLDQHGKQIAEDALPEPLAALRFDLVALRAEFQRRAATGGLHYAPDLMAALTSLLPAVDPARQARGHLQRAMMLLGQGQVAEAEDAARQGRVIYAALGHRQGELDALEQQFEIAYWAGDMVAVGRLMGELRALEATQRVELRWTLTYNELRVAIYQAEWSRALALAQALVSTDAHADQAVAWHSLALLGQAYLQLGALEQAYTLAQQAVAASEAAGVLGLGAQVLLARLEFKRGAMAQGQARLLGLLESANPLIGESEVVGPALALVRSYAVAGESEKARQWARRASQAVARVRLPALFPLSQVAWAIVHLAAGAFDEARRRLRYPLEHLMLLEDISAQEVLALRAAAAQGLGDRQAARHWLEAASATLHEQAARIDDPGLRESFLHNVPLHRAILAAAAGQPWEPQTLITV